MTEAFDLEEACDDVRHSMASDDRQTKAEYQRGCQALSSMENEVTRLRLELANALSIANGRTYRMDSPEVLKARVGELEKVLAGVHLQLSTSLDAIDVRDDCLNELRRELAEARAIGEQSRITKVEAAMLTDAMRYPDNGALHCRWCSAGPREGHESRCWYAEQVRRVDAAKQLTDRLSARAATGEPKEAT